MGCSILIRARKDFPISNLKFQISQAERGRAPAPAGYRPMPRPSPSFDEILQILSVKIFEELPISYG